jgi:hypothetical protein
LSLKYVVVEEEEEKTTNEEAKTIVDTIYLWEWSRVLHVPCNNVLIYSTSFVYKIF